MLSRISSSVALQPVGYAGLLLPPVNALPDQAIRLLRAANLMYIDLPMTGKLLAQRISGVLFTLPSEMATPRAFKENSL